MLKMFATFHPRLVPELSDALCDEGFNIPLDEFAFRARAPGFGTKVAQFLRGGWHVPRLVIWGSVLFLVREAIQLRAHFRRRLDGHLEKAMPSGAVPRKWHLQELKYYLGRSLYLEPFGDYECLEAATANVSETRETWSVIHAVATGDITEVIRTSGHAPQTLVGLLRPGGVVPSLTHDQQAWSEAEVQALALLRLHGVAVTPAPARAAERPRPADVETSPLHRVGGGLVPLPGTATPCGYFDELACLGEGRPEEERLRTLATRFSADEEVTFDALALDQLSGDEPRLDMIDPTADLY